MYIRVVGFDAVFGQPSLRDEKVEEEFAGGREFCRELVRFDGASPVSLRLEGLSRVLGYQPERGSGWYLRTVYSTAKSL